MDQRPDSTSILSMVAGMGIDLFSMNSGPAVHVRDLHRGFTKLGRQVSILCAGPRQRILHLGDGTVIRGVGAPRGSIFFTGILDIQEWMYSRRFEREGLRLAEHLHPSFIYERYSLFNMGGVRLARRLKIPHILEVNAPLRLERAHYRKIRIEPLAARCERAVLDSTSALVVVSEPLARHFEKLDVSRDRIHVLPNGVDEERFHPELDAMAERSRLGIPNHCPVVGHVGTLKPWHGTADLAQCLVHCLRAVNDLRAIIVGDGPGLPLLKRHCAEAGVEERVAFTHAVSADRVPGLVAAADLMLALYPADQNFYFSPLKVVEAMAASRPVVASGAQPVKDLIDHQESGILVPPGDWKAAAEAVLSLVDDPENRRRLGRRAAAKVLEHHTWRHVAERILEIAGEAQHHER